MNGPWVRVTADVTHGDVARITDAWVRSNAVVAFCPVGNGTGTLLFLAGLTGPLQVADTPERMLQALNEAGL
jgi:hypothetical protein